MLNYYFLLKIRLDVRSICIKFYLSDLAKLEFINYIPKAYPTHQAAWQQTVLKNPTQKSSHVYAKEVDRVRDTLGEGFREEFDQLMPTQTTLNPSIYAWKRSVIPPNPEEPVNIDTSCPFFLTSSGENICKASVDIGGDPRRRLLLLTTDKVMKKGLRFAKRGVMDATFDVSII